MARRVAVCLCVSNLQQGLWQRLAAERELFERLHDADASDAEQAGVRDELIETHMPLVHHLAASLRHTAPLLKCLHHRAPLVDLLLVGLLLTLLLQRLRLLL